MRTSARAAISALMAAAALAALVGSASARNLSISNQQFRIVWSSLEFVNEFVPVRCNVTIEGSFHSRSFAKVTGALVGLVTAARFGHPCTNGEAWTYNGAERLSGTTLSNTLPWHVRYDNFSGTLPRITFLRFYISEFRILVRWFGGACTETVNLAIGGNVNASGVLDRMQTGGLASCLVGGGVTSRSEDGLLTLAGAATRITVTLI